MNPYEIESFVNRGDEFYERGDYDKAIDFYIRALEMNTKNREGLEGLGQSYAALCTWERAAKDKLWLKSVS